MAVVVWTKPPANMQFFALFHAPPGNSETANLTQVRRFGTRAPDNKSAPPTSDQNLRPSLCTFQVPPWVVSPKRPNPALRAHPACTTWYPEASRTVARPMHTSRRVVGWAKGNCHSSPWCQNASVIPICTRSKLSQTRASKNASMTCAFPQKNQQTTLSNPISQPNTERRLNPICQPNTRQQLTPLPPSVLGTEEHHPAFVYRPELAVLPLCSRHAHQTACSTSHAGKPLRGFSLHWCGAARSVVTRSIETDDDTQPFTRARYNAKHPSLNPNIPPVRSLIQKQRTSKYHSN